jgi:TAP-like protein
VELARELGAPLITFDGTQHTAVFNGDACVDVAVVRYLVDQVEPDNLHC